MLAGSNVGTSIGSTPNQAYIRGSDVKTVSLYADKIIVSNLDFKRRQGNLG